MGGTRIADPLVAGVPEAWSPEDERAPLKEVYLPTRSDSIGSVSAAVGCSACFSCVGFGTRFLPEIDRTKVKRSCSFVNYASNIQNLDLVIQGQQPSPTDSVRRSSSQFGNKTKVPRGTRVDVG